MPRPAPSSLPRYIARSAAISSASGLSPWVADAALVRGRQHPVHGRVPPATVSRPSRGHERGRMIRTTPFHERTSALNESGLWSHWSGYLAAEKYQPVGEVRVLRRPQRGRHLRHVAAVQVPVHGSRRGGVPRRRARPRPADARSPARRSTRSGATTAGSLVEDGVLLRHAADEFVLTAAEPNFAWFADLVGPRRRTSGSRTSRSEWAVLALQGPRRAALLAGLDPRIERLAYFEHPQGEDRRQAGHGLAHRLHRRPGLRGLGRRPRTRSPVWDAVWEASRGPRRAAVRAPGAVHDPHRGRAAAARRRLRVQPVRLDGRRPRDARTSWASAGCSGASRGRAAVHRPRRDPAGAARAARRASGRPGSSSTGATGTGSTTRPG